jgi:signal transduction histidine kinase
MRLRQWRQEMQLRFEERLAERTRIAQELHDTLLQGFLGASMQLHVATEALPAESPQRKPFERVAGLMSQVIDEGRNALRGLRSQSTGKAGLAKELADTPGSMGFVVGENYRVIVDGEARRIEPAAREEIYRIGREAILNAFRHASAENIEVELFYTSRSFRMRVRDDGCGMDPQLLESGKPGHWGLAGMRERARKFGAELVVRSKVAGGTEVELAAPGSRVFAKDRTRNWTDRLTAWMNRKEAA